MLISPPGNMYTLNWEPFRCRTIYYFYPFLYDDKNSIMINDISWDNISMTFADKFIIPLNLHQLVFVTLALIQYQDDILPV